MTDQERTAVVNRDVGAFYGMGTHPVIINGYCRAMGYKRADYKPLLAAYANTEEERPMADIVMASSASHAPMMSAAGDLLPAALADLPDQESGTNRGRQATKAAGL